MRGQQAIQNIVRRFERPADPGTEIARAAAAYGGTGTVGDVVANAVVPGAAPPREIPASGRPRTKQVTIQQRVFDNAALAQGIFSALAGGGTPDVGSLVSSSWRNVPLTTQLTLPPVPGLNPLSHPPTAGPGAGVQPLTTKRGKVKGWFDPATGKIIGTPGKGTHTLGNWESDRALDIALKMGSPIYAPFSGVVGQQFGALGSADPRFAGLRLHVVGPTNEWYGAHLSRFAPGIHPGVRVTPGELLGYSGVANGVAHLHEALKYGDPYGLLR
jgi:murein DD-endopeptidase MepM/ murein hydrolase activator NlpD